MCESVCDWIEIRCWNSPLESQSMAPGFFSPSKTDCFSPFHLTLKAFPFLSFFIFSLQSSPTISINNYTTNNNNRDANSHISFLLLPFTYLYYTFVENTITIYKIYIYIYIYSVFLCFSSVFYGTFVNTQIDFFVF